MIGGGGEPRRAVGALVYGSGFCALVYQVVWLRELRLVFGSSTPASAAVLAVFMGGLGLGGLLLGKRAERSPRPLAFYGWLEVGAALAAGISPWTIAAVRWLYLAAGGESALGQLGAAVVRLALTALVLGLPTFLMGGTLPAMGRAVTALAEPGRRSLGWLYGWNTLGAVTGATLTTFWMIEGLGQRKSLWIATMLNLLVAWIALSLARRRAPLSADTETIAVSSRGAAAPLPVVLCAAAVVGFAFFLMELVWYRTLSPLLGGSTYTFGAILLLALAGIGAGGLLYGAAPPRAPSLRSLATTCGLEALVLLLPMVFGPQLALLTFSLRALGAEGFYGFAAGWLLVGGLVVFPASLLAGYQFPLLVALLGEGRREVARQTGLVAACNTVGAIAGSLAGGFGLLPLLGASAAWRIAALVLVGLAALGLLLEALRQPSLARGWRWALPVAAVLAAGGLSTVSGPGALWRHGGIGAGRSNLDEVRDPNQFRARVLSAEADLVWERDGRESAVGLIGRVGLAFAVNGKIDGNSRLDAGTQVMSPLVGSMLHANPRRALVIGLGTGSSAGWLGVIPGMERVDVIELEPAVVDVARDCAAVNQRVLENPLVHVTLGDAREVLVTRPGTWDVIVSEPSNPFRAGIASLFTREFYHSVDERLAPGGIFVQWVQAYEVDAQAIATVYRTLVEVFPAVESWHSQQGDLLLVAAREELQHDLARVARRAANEPYRSALASAWGVRGAEGFYAGFIAGAPFATRVAAAGAPPNLDDRQVLEFGFARELGRGSFDLRELRRNVRPEEARPPGTEGLDRARVADAAAARGLMERREASVLVEDPGLAARNRARNASRDGNLRVLLAHWRAQQGEPDHPIDVVMVAEALAEAGDETALAVIEKLGPAHQLERLAVLARLRLRQQRMEEGADALARALERYRQDPWPWPVLTTRLIALVPLFREPAQAGRLAAALAQPFVVRMHEDQRERTRIIAAMRAGEGACVEAFRAREPHPFWEERLLQSRLACYAQAGDPLEAKASDDLVAFLDRRPRTLGEWLAEAEEPSAAATPSSD